MDPQFAQPRIKLWIEGSTCNTLFILPVILDLLGVLSMAFISIARINETLGLREEHIDCYCYKDRKFDVCSTSLQFVHQH